MAGTGDNDKEHRSGGTLVARRPAGDGGGWVVNKENREKGVVGCGSEAIKKRGVDVGARFFLLSSRCWGNWPCWIDGCSGIGIGIGTGTGMKTGMG